MIPFSRHSLKKPNFVLQAALLKNSLLGTRHASLTSAIGRAARKSVATEISRESRYTRTGKPSDKLRPLAPNGRSVAFSPEVETPSDDKDNKSKLPHWIARRRGKKHGKGSFNIPRKRGLQHRPTDEMPERVKKNVLVPQSVPYTTPASEFIYGLSACEAALRCSRRKLYVLYIYQKVGEPLDQDRITLRKLALAHGIKVKMAFGKWDQLLDKMSAGRQHNGCVLEVSPLPQLPVACLEPVPAPTEDHFRVSLGAQSREEAAVNGSSNQVARAPRYTEAEQARFPLVILVDGILDPGNMGAVMRSAYYLGVDALVLAGRNSAPMSPVTIKASAGATENMTVLKASNEIDFIRRSRENGWRFYAADSPANVADMAMNNKVLTEGESDSAEAAGGGSTGNLLTSAPTVLMFGSEESGLLPRIKAQADGFITIPGARIRPDMGINDAARVDSLNVSVAAALLIEKLMRVPLRMATLARPSASVSASTKDVEDKTTESPPRSFDFN